MPSSSNRALDRLKKAANLEPSKKVVQLSDGTDFEFYSAPLTMAERERAQKGTNDDSGLFALQLLILKAQDETGQRLFSFGEIAELKREVRDADLQALMLAVITDDEEQEAPDPKD
ncbi:MAG: hypothetical protein DWQ28_08270 [Proteobacteria bacterium]|jgi:hypothetical protein|nr:MAG: hypothetical protein DWQ28_08270 [Pseudomonadota bacterium]|tara:strand:+ start:621 stop:968 length:348 start_codon:yes stop_codon:yes gene_type:complete